MRKEIAATLVALVAQVALAGAARADGTEAVVSKCIAPDGAVTYRSGRCEAGDAAAGSWSAAPSPANGPPAAEAKARARRRAADAAYLRKLANRYRGRAAHTAPPRAADGCEKAREARAHARRNAHLDYDARDKLDDAVMQACY